MELINKMSYLDFLGEQYHSAFLISDSGTAQEEAALLGTPVYVPREFTERPQSMRNNCSWMGNSDNTDCDLFDVWLSNFMFNDKQKIQTEWLGDGTTAYKIVSTLRSIL
jgi:UDP-N-acetylglucosamine 2-epimerase